MSREECEAGESALLGQVRAAPDVLVQTLDSWAGAS
jgi:hypothetical protein